MYPSLCQSPKDVGNWRTSKTDIVLSVALVVNPSQSLSAKTSLRSHVDADIVGWEKGSVWIAIRTEPTTISLRHTYSCNRLKSML